jgi:predicted aspartyl protease
MIDTGASGYIFLNRSLAQRLSNALNTRIRRLPHPVPVRGFTNDISTSVSQYIRLHLTIDKRRIYNCPIVILDLGSHDMIIGNKLLKKFKIRLDPFNNRFIWPSDYPPTPTFTKEILLSYESQRSPWKVLDHQKDANRRTRAIEADEIRRYGGCQNQPRLLLLRRATSEVLLSEHRPPSLGHQPRYEAKHLVTDRTGQPDLPAKKSNPKEPRDPSVPPQKPRCILNNC